jgi:hypothetical protein
MQYCYFISSVWYLMMDHISRVGVFLEVAKYERFAGAARA